MPIDLIPIGYVATGLIPIGFRYVMTVKLFLNLCRMDRFTVQGPLTKKDVRQKNYFAVFQFWWYLQEHHMSNNVILFKYLFERSFPIIIF